MNLVTNIKKSLNGLRANKKRAFLTTLGIVIGIAAVIIIVSVGAGAQSLIVNEIIAMGSDLASVMPGYAEEEGPPATAMGVVLTNLKNQDMESLKDQGKVPYLKAVTGYVRGVDTISWQSQKTDATFLGTTEDYASVEGGQVEHGRFFTNDEVKGVSKVVVLGWQVAQDLFGDSDPLGERVKIKHESFRVIGIMEKRGSVTFENRDTQVFVPLLTAQKLLLGINYLSMIRFKVTDQRYLDQTKEDVRQVLRENHNIDFNEEDDFLVRGIDEAIDALTTITNAIKYFLAAIAAMSLLVGGIGIMNIMLISVTERTKEIGLRKAVGANSANILSQFLVESIVMTLIGAILGIVLGILISYLIAVVANLLGYKWDFVVTYISILLSVGVAGVVGLIFGVYPAKKAAGLQPVEALRYE